MKEGLVMKSAGVPGREDMEAINIDRKSVV